MSLTDFCVDAVAVVVGRHAETGFAEVDEAGQAEVPDPEPAVEESSAADELSPEKQKKLEKQQRKAEKQRRNEEKKKKKVKRSVYLTVPIV